MSAIDPSVGGGAFAARPVRSGPAHACAHRATASCAWWLLPAFAGNSFTLRCANSSIARRDIGGHAAREWWVKGCAGAGSRRASGFSQSSWLCVGAQSACATPRDRCPHGVGALQVAERARAIHAQKGRRLARASSATAAGASAAATASVPAVAAFTPLLLLYAATRLSR